MSSRDRIAMTAGLGALALGVMAIGGASRWAVVALAGLAVAAAASQIASRRRLAGVSPLLVVIGTAVILTAIQLVPVPGAMVAMLERTAHELIVDGELLPSRIAVDNASPESRPGLERDLARERTRRADRWRPLSHDPASTRVELVELCAYFLIAWMALRAAASERGRERLLAGVAGIAGAVALIAVVHELLGAEQLFGFYQPAHVHPVVMAPLLNANHLACLMALGALTAGGLAFHERRAPALRAMWIITGLLCFGVLLATASRGGVMGLAAGTTVTALVMVLQRMRAAPETKRRDVLRVALPAAVIVLCSMVLVVYLGGGQVRAQLESTQLDELSDPRSKYAAWGSAIALFEEAPVFGVGRGAFESAFTRVHPASAHVTFSHVENEYIQAVVDWGIVGGVALAGGLGFALLVIRRRWRNGALAAAAIGGLTAVAVQSLVDFGLELPGVAIPTVIVASTLLYVPLREASRSRRLIGTRLVAVLATLGVAAVGAAPFSRTVGEDHDTLRAEATDLAEARSTFSRHPLDYLAAAYIARASTDNRERLAYLNHALRLHPRHPDLHRAVARWLALTGHSSQAAIEFRLALLGTDEPDVLIIEILTLFPAVPDAVAALPANYRSWSRALAALTQARRHDVALAYLEKIASAPGAHPPPELWRRMATLAQAAGNLVLAERAATALTQFDPSVGAILGLARIQLQREAYDLAIATLTPVTTAVVTSTDHVEARVLLCQVHMARLAWAEAHACLTAILQAPAVTLEMRRKVHTNLATVEDALGNKDRAELERKLAAPGGIKRDEPRSGVAGSGGSR